MESEIRRDVWIVWSKLLLTATEDRECVDRLGVKS